MAVSWEKNINYMFNPFIGLKKIVYPITMYLNIELL